MGRCVLYAITVEGEEVKALFHSETSFAAGKIVDKKYKDLLNIELVKVQAYIEWSVW